MIEWIPLTSSEGITELTSKSYQKDQLIFKHSPRCSISVMALEKFESADPKPNIDYYKLHVVDDRPVSLEVASTFDVIHQSPQILQIRDGKCVMDQSHWAISMDEVLEPSAC